MVKDHDIVAIRPSITVDEAVNGYFLRYGYGGFPVVDHGKFLGITTLKEIKNIPREMWGNATIANILVPHNKSWELSPQDDVMKTLELMIREDRGRIIVTKNDSVIGLITRNGIARYVQLKGK